MVTIALSPLRATVLLIRGHQVSYKKQADVVLLKGGSAAFRVRVGALHIFANQGLTSFAFCVLLTILGQCRIPRLK